MDEDIAAKQRGQRQQIEDREAARYNDMVAERNRADRFIQEWQIHHEQGERAKQVLQKEQWQREAEGDIADVRIRALIAAGESRDFVQAVRREGAMITQEHADLQRDIALEKDPDKKQSLELKRDIQHADYMALANERIAAMSNLNSEQYKEAQRQQEEWTRSGTDLRKERLELQEQMALREAQKISEEVERVAKAEEMNRADRQREEFRSDIRGPVAQNNRPETPREAVQANEARGGELVRPRRKRAPARPSVRQKRFIPNLPFRLPTSSGSSTAARENTDAQQEQHRRECRDHRYEGGEESRACGAPRGNRTKHPAGARARLRTLAISRRQTRHRQAGSKTSLDNTSRNPTPSRPCHSLLVHSHRRRRRREPDRSGSFSPRCKRR